MEKSIMKKSIVALLALALCRLSAVSVYADLAPAPEKKGVTIWIVILVVVVVAAAVYLFMKKGKKD